MTDYLCPVCENIYDTPEDAAECCAEPQPEWDERDGRERGDDDGREYGHPGDRLRGIE